MKGYFFLPWLTEAFFTKMQYFIYLDYTTEDTQCE